MAHDYDEGWGFDNPESSGYDSWEDPDGWGSDGDYDSDPWSDELDSYNSVLESYDEREFVEGLESGDAAYADAASAAAMRPSEYTPRDIWLHNHPEEKRAFMEMHSVAKARQAAAEFYHSCLADPRAALVEPAEETMRRARESSDARAVARAQTRLEQAHEMYAGCIKTRNALISCGALEIGDGPFYFPIPDRMGIAPGRGWALRDHLRGLGISNADMKSAGLVEEKRAKAGKGTWISDVLSGYRATFALPCEDESGVGGFAGILLEDNDSRGRPVPDKIRYLTTGSTIDSQKAEAMPYEKWKDERLASAGPEKKPKTDRREWKRDACRPSPEFSFARFDEERAVYATSWDINEAKYRGGAIIANNPLQAEQIKTALPGYPVISPARGSETNPNTGRRQFAPAHVRDALAKISGREDGVYALMEQGAAFLGEGGAQRASEMVRRWYSEGIERLLDVAPDSETIDLEYLGDALGTTPEEARRTAGEEWSALPEHVRDAIWHSSSEFDLRPSFDPRAKTAKPAGITDEDSLGLDFADEEKYGPSPDMFVPDVSEFDVPDDFGIDDDYMFADVPDYQQATESRLQTSPVDDYDGLKAQSHDLSGGLAAVSERSRKHGPVL